MGRYLRLYAYFLRFSFSRAMEFRVDFFFRVLMDLLWYATYTLFFTVLFRHTQMLGGWNYDQVLVFAGTMFVADAIQMTVVSNNMWWLPIFVNRGDLDYYLVRPVSSLFFLSVRGFAANSFLNLLMAVGFWVWALARYPEPLSLSRVLVFTLLTCLGAFLMYVMTMLFIIPVFWLHSKTGLRELGWTVQRLSGRPHRIFRGWVRAIIVSVLPVAFMASYPVEALFAGPSALLLLHTAAVVAGLFGFMLWFWRRGLRAYSSA
jgi:ABC-2 type transport system permease protein